MRAGRGRLRRSLIVVAAVLIVVELAAYANVSGRNAATTIGAITVAGNRFAYLDDGTIRSDGQCLTGPGEAATAKTALTLQACDGGTRQQWRQLGGDAMLNKASGLCLNSLPSDGSPWAYPCGSVQANAATPSASSGVPAPPEPAEPAKADPSGVAMPRGDQPGWRQIFTDDFSEDVPLGGFPGAVSDRWGGYDQLHDTSGNGLYAPKQVVSVAGGLMNLHLHTDGGTHLVAAPIAKLPGAGPGGGMLYGRYAVRFRSDPVPGYKTAWLLWPDTDDWPDGEIDFPEGQLDWRIVAHSHKMGEPQVATSHQTDTKYTAWHTAIVEWTPQHINFILDGKIIGHDADKAYIPSTPMHWVLQTETNVNGTTPTDQAQGNVQIDWVAVWARI